jgi:hypothetical protein
MHAVSGKFGKSVSVDNNRVVIHSLSPASSSAIDFELDASFHYTQVCFSPFSPIFALVCAEHIKLHDAANGNLVFSLEVEQTARFVSNIVLGSSLNFSLC